MHVRILYLIVTYHEFQVEISLIRLLISQIKQIQLQKVEID